MIDWLTAREIADEHLPDMPATERGVQMLAERSGWPDHPSLVRRRAGRDGGGGLEFHIDLLPVLAQVAYRQKHMVVTQAVPGAPDGLTARAQVERDARLAILAAYSAFTRGLGLGHATHVQVFTDRYNTGLISVDAWVRETVPAISKRTLIRWQSAKRDGKAEALAHDPAQARKGKGLLATANGGAVQRFVLAMIAHQPFLSAAALRIQCRHEFGDTIEAVSKGVRTTFDMPPVRTFQHFIAQMKVEHKTALTKLTNPDLFRSTMKLSGVGTLRHITEPNALWQIDASPVDALCLDGRHSVYACIDIATRRSIWLLSRTPRASAVALLIRKAILAWGVPERVKTDNGSDFVARDTTRLFASLGIEAERSDAYSPEQKGHVERAIKTFQHEVGPLLPGFIGHSVTDRKSIEARKSFAARLGESDADTFAVSLDGPQLQQHIDDWATLVYARRPHGGLQDRSPEEVARQSTRPIRTVDERALDLLLMPVAGSDGRRIATKFGIRIDHYHYLAPTIMPGTPVFVRQDPADLGRALVFAEDGGTFLAEAICAELRGIHPETFVRAAREIQAEKLHDATRVIKADMKRIAKGPALIERALTVARRDASNVIALPKREERHSTAQISAAIEAMSEQVSPTRPLDARAAAEHRRMLEEMRAEDEARVSESVEAIYARRAAEIEADRTAHLPKDRNVVALPETAKERYRRAFGVRTAIDGGSAVLPADAVWLGRYETSAEFKAQARMHEDFGDAYLS